jgi:hypothetical protein
MSAVIPVPASGTGTHASIPAVGQAVRLRTQTYLVEAVDPSWSGTLDSLRAPPQAGQTGYHWRKESPIRPVVFTAPEGIDDDIVQLHLEERGEQERASAPVTIDFR